MKHSLNHILNALCLTLLVTSHYLLYHAYPVFSPEALLFILILFVLLILPYALLKSLKLEWFYEVLLLTFFFDLSIGFGFRDKVFWPVFLIPRDAPDLLFLFFSPVYFIVGNALEHLPNRLCILAVSYLLFMIPIGFIIYRLRQKISKIFLIALLSMIAGTVLQHFLSPRPLIRMIKHENQNLTGQNRPNTLILILDEHVGIEGIPLIDENAKILKLKLIEDYTQNGFTVYGRTYSNYYNTFKSIPSLLNYAFFQEETYKLPDSYAVLEKYYQAGDAVNIYQSNYYDYCAAAKGRLHQCLEYDKNSVGFLADTPLPAHQKALAITASFFEAHKSALLRKGYWRLSEKYRWLPAGHVEAVAAMKVFEQLKQDIAEQKNGTVFFAHLLIPHSPYLYDSECRLKAIPDWEQRLITNRSDINASWQKKSARYLDQMACTHKKVSELFEIMRANGIYDHTNIIIFGDHGSRIYSTMPHEEQKDMEWLFENSTARDLVELFSTFLVIKKAGPIEKGQYISEKMPSIRVLGNFFEITPQSQAEEAYDKIYMQGRSSKKLLPQEMIDF